VRAAKSRIWSPWLLKKTSLPTGSAPARRSYVVCSSENKEGDIGKYAVCPLLFGQAGLTKSRRRWPTR
jgi:hypothetical protein